MTPFIKSFHCDLIKLKNTFSIRLAIFASAMIVTVNFLVIQFKGQNFISQNSPEAWMKLIKMGFKFVCVLIIPFYIILQTTLLVNLEHKSNTWKHILTLPVQRGYQYFSKFFIVLILNILTLSLFVLFIFLAGDLLSLTRPELGFTNFNINYAFLFAYAYKVFISSLAITALQYVISLNIRDLTKSLGLGVAGIIVTVIIISWKYVWILPQSYTSLTSGKYDAYKTGLVQWNLYDHEIYSLLYTAVILLIGYIIFKKRNVDY
jgi:lantibiotic transport system permease protein